MKKRRRRVLVLVAGAVAAPFGAFAQQFTKVPRIGFLHPAPPRGVPELRLQALRDGLRDLGYVEGRNVQLEIRWGNGDFARLPSLAADLVELKVDVIVAAAGAEVVAQRATSSIPIVMPVSSDPVGDGLVASFSHPGGNITGLSMMAPELGEKRLQLLGETFPTSPRAVVVMWNPAYLGMRARFDQVKGAAPTLGLTVQSLEVRDAAELNAAFEALANVQVEALVLSDPFTLSQRARIVEFVAKHRLAAIYENSEFVDEGGLMSYGPNISDLWRRAALYVDKILRGAKPGDLPIEQPTKFELVLNTKAAKALGISFPASILMRADRVIE